jgi:hypothetical protein
MVRVVDVKGLESQEPYRVTIEDPVAPHSAAVFAGAVLVFGGCAWLFGPIRRQRNNVPWLVFFLAVLHLLFWASQPVGTQTDSRGYVESFPIVLAGAPSSFPPGYPVLLGMVGSLASGHLGTWITLIQHGMVVLSALWLYLLLRRVMPEALALLGGVLAGAVAPSLTVPQSVLSETTTCFAMVGALYCAVRSNETRKLLPTVLAGVLVGWGFTLRVVPVAALFPAISILYLSPPTKNGFRRIAVTAAAMLFTGLLPVLWFGYKSGQPKLTESLGTHLYDRVVYDQKLLNENGPATHRLLTLLASKNPRDYYGWELTPQKEFLELGYGNAELLLRDVALEAVYKNPWRFLLYTPKLAWRIFVVPTNWIPNWADTPSTDPYLENPTAVAVTASSLGWRWSLEHVHSALWPVFCWAAIAGTLLELLSRRNPLILAMAWIIVGYLLASGLAEVSAPRYNAPIVPFVAVLALLPLDQIRMAVSRWRDAQALRSKLRKNLSPKISAAAHVSSQYSCAALALRDQLRQ